MSRPLLLLVDDSQEMGLIVASLGRRAGWEVGHCLDAAAGWERLARRRPDLVLLDVNLPGPSGLDWLRRVRRAPEYAGLAVALYTHWGLAADVAAGLDAGVDFVFDKDLAARPAEWQHRLAEIGEIGRAGERGGAWPPGGPRDRMAGAVVVPPLKECTAAFLQALRRPPLRRVNGEVLPALLRRALTEALPPRILPPDIEAWASYGLDPERIPPTLDPTVGVNLAVSLAEQIQRLLGNEAAAAFRDATAAALPGVRELLSWP